MKLSSLRHSIARKLLTIVFSLYTIVTVTLTGLHMYFDYQNANQRIHEELKFYASMILPTLSESIWNFSSEAIQTVIQGITQSPSVIGAEILDERGNQWNSGYAMNSGPSHVMRYYDPKTGEVNDTKTISSSSSFNYNENIYFNDGTGQKIKIGQLILYSSSNIVFQQVQEAFIMILVNAAIKIIALWILFLVYGYKLLTQPLSALTEATQKVRQGIFKIDPLPANSNWPTEIEILNDNFNVMTHDLELSQERLISAQARTRSIIDSMPSMIIGLNKTLNITDWNKQIREFSGQDIQVAQQKEFLSVSPEYQFIKPMIEKVILEKTTEFVQKQSVYHNNKRYYQDILVYPIALDGDPGAVIRIDDVTGKMQLEEAMVQTEKLSSVGTMASGMAHQMNTPVGTISQNIQNITRRLDPKLAANKEVAAEVSVDLEAVHQYFEKRKITSFLEQIDQSTQEVSKILKNLLQFSMPSTSVKSSLSLKHVLDHTIDLAKSDFDLTKKMHFSEISMTITVADNLPAVYGSAADLEQVLLSLMKYSAQTMQYQDHARKITIDLSLNDKGIILRMSDNGPGVEEDIKDHIFDPFFTQKNVGEQVGMGLAVAHKLVTDGHGGGLSVENIKPTGLCFTIVLPKGIA